ncbi:MAG: hypothetical protein OHK0013_04540 [Sandaracinaceae bacterium]
MPRRDAMPWTRRLALCSIAASIAMAACGPRGGDPVDAGSGRRCSISAECDDGFPCTVDTCGVDMFCTYTPIDAVCTGEGERCVVGVGCTSTVTCTSSAECDDGFACTVDSCSASRTCEHQAVDALCTDPTRPTCDPAMGCVAGTSRCRSNPDCDDGVACTVDVCAAGGTCMRTPVNSMCNTAAGEVCTSTGCRVPMTCTTDEDCQDGNFCNGRERCIPELGCQPATMMPRCDDGQACTRDSCDPAMGCVYTCDASMPGCMCGGEIDCVGRFALTPVPADSCASGMVDYSLGAIEIAIAGGQAFVDPIAPSRASFGTLTDTSASCPRVTAQARVEGAVPEVFTLDVTFESSDRFTGTFDANYGGLGLLGGCREGPVSVTGVRMP